MKKLLIISPSFPPMNTADMQRVRLSLPYYRENGWEPIVLCVGPEYQNAPREEALLATLPPDLKLYQTAALPLRLCRLFGVGNLGLRSFLHLLISGLRLIRREKPDLIFISTAQFALFPLARIWTALCGVPCVVDLHDPWVTDAYTKPGAPLPPGGWKYRFASLSARILEGWSFRRLAGLLSVSEIYLRDLRGRHREFARVPTRVLGFGVSEADLAAAPPPALRRQPSVVSIVYTGASGPCLNRILPEFLTGLALLRQHMPASALRLRIQFVGTSYVARGEGKVSVLPQAVSLGIADLVSEIPYRLGYLECLAHQRDADVLLLLGSSDPAYSPSKVYPYILSGRPILALAPPGSVLENILKGLSCSRFIPVELDAPLGSSSALIAAALADASSGLPLEDLTARNLERFHSEFLAPNLVRQQCEFLAEALSFHRNPPAREAS